MFVLCPHCQFLVALDPISGEPPLRCPRCAGRLQPGSDPDPDPDPDSDAAVPAPAAGVPMESVDNTGPDTIQASASDPVPDDPATADHDHDAGSAQISNEALPDEAVADEAVEDESLTDEPATVEPVIAEPDAVESDTVDPDDLESNAVETDAVELPSTHASTEANPVDSIDAEPAVEGDVVATAEDTDDQDRNAIGTQHFDPVEDAETPATEPADALIEAMLGPAAIEIEAATETSGEMPADPIDEPPTDVPQSSGNGTETAPSLVIEDLEPATGPAADPTPAPAAETEEPPAATQVPPAPATRKPTPSFVRRPPAVSGVASRRRWLAAVAIALLTLALLLQLLLADRARLAADARWRPALSTLCGALHCTLPPWREPVAITLLRRDVRPHPTIRGALRVTATFRNDARWAQPWPGVLLTLSDVDGRAVAVRTFLPREYLAARTTGAAATQTTLASGHSKTIVLDIVEPTPRIVAFTFDFQ